jgi:hypothetical protein
MNFLREDEVMLKKVGVVLEGGGRTLGKVLPSGNRVFR